MALREATVARRETLFREAAEIIERDYPRQLSLGGVAAEIATSRRQLQRAFAEAGETCFRSYLTRVRMRRALALLSDRSLPVQQVARRVGYRQPAQFAKSFRRYHGAAPSHVRGNAHGGVSEMTRPHFEPAVAAGTAAARFQRPEAADTAAPLEPAAAGAS